MKKRDKIIYWIATIWLSFGMLSSAAVQILQIEEEVKTMNAIGYPGYFLIIIGVWKVLGVIAILVPKYPLVKEWAYAGFFFLMSGALISHLAVGDEASTFFGAGLLLVMTCISWYFRPLDRKILVR